MLIMDNITPARTAWLIAMVLLFMLILFVWWRIQFPSHIRRYSGKLRRLGDVIDHTTNAIDKNFDTIPVTDASLQRLSEKRPYTDDALAAMQYALYSVYGENKWQYRHILSSPGKSRFLDKRRKICESVGTSFIWDSITIDQAHKKNAIIVTTSKRRKDELTRIAKYLWVEVVIRVADINCGVKYDWAIIDEFATIIK